MIEGQRRVVSALALGATAALLLVSSSTGGSDVELEYKWKGCVCYVCGLGVSDVSVFVWYVWVKEGMCMRDIERASERARRERERERERERQSIRVCRNTNPHT